MAKKSGHARKKWKVTIKLPQVFHGKTHHPVDLDVNEFTYEALGHNAGVAVQRAFTLLRGDLFGVSYRDCFISVKCLGDYTKAMEAEELGIPYTPAPLKGIAKRNVEARAKEQPVKDTPSTIAGEGFTKTRSWDEYMRTEGYKEYDLPTPTKDKEPGPITCPWCKTNISSYKKGSLGYTKHMVGECCIGLGEEDGA